MRPGPPPGVSWLRPDPCPHHACRPGPSAVRTGHREWRGSMEKRHDIQEGHERKQGRRAPGEDATDRPHLSPQGVKCLSGGGGLHLDSPGPAVSRCKPRTGQDEVCDGDSCETAGVVGRQRATARGGAAEDSRRLMRGQTPRPRSCLATWKTCTQSKTSSPHTPEQGPQPPQTTRRKVTQKQVSVPLTQPGSQGLGPSNELLSPQMRSHKVGPRATVPPTRLRGPCWESQPPGRASRGLWSDTHLTMRWGS